MACVLFCGVLSNSSHRILLCCPTAPLVTVAVALSPLPERLACANALLAARSLNLTACLAYYSLHHTARRSGETHTRHTSAAAQCLGTSEVLQRLRSQLNSSWTAPGAAATPHIP